MRSLVLWGGLLVAVWLYDSYWIEPPLRYQARSPVFFWRMDFVAAHGARFGGLLDFVAAGMAHLDSRVWAGGSAATLLFGLMLASWTVVLRRAGQCRTGWSLLPVLPWLVIEGQYDSPVAAMGVGVVVALAGLAFWQIARPERAGLRWAMFWMATAAALYLAGPAPALLFVILGTAWELSPAVRLRHAVVEKARTEPDHAAQRRISPGIGAAVCGSAALLVVGGAVVAPGLSAAEQVGQWGTRTSLVACALLCLVFPVGLWFGSRGSGVRRDPPRPLRWVWGAVGLAVAAAVLAVTFDGARRTVLRIESEARLGHWERAIDAAQDLRGQPGPATRLALCQALYQRGRLTADLFTFGQRRGVDLLPSLRDGLRVCPPLSDTLLELGQVNLAEHMAHEALENLGETPHLLWQLARINVLLDRPRAARVFLNRLRDVPFHRSAAEQRLRALEVDPTLAGEVDIARVRPWRVTLDYADSGVPTELLLRQLLQSNRRNRMAYEYLVAHYLLTGQTEPVVQELGRLDELGQWETPRHIEEAMLAYLAERGEGRTEIGGRRPGAATAQRHREFRARLERNGGRGGGIEIELAREFGDTFWFYQLFGATFGGATPVFITARP